MFITKGGAVALLLPCLVSGFLAPIPRGGKLKICLYIQLHPHHALVVRKSGIITGSMIRWNDDED